MADRPIGWRGLWKAGGTFLKKLVVPHSAGDPAGVTDYEIWIDDTSGKLAFRIGGATVLLPLPSELTAAGLNQEQAEDLVQAMFTGADMAAGDITWEYTDNAGAPGTIKGTIKNSSITYAKMQNVTATARVLGRISAGAGVIEELTGANLKTIIGALANADLATMTQGTIKGRAAGAGTGTPVDLTAAQVKALLGITPADIAMAATARVVGRATAGAGPAEELTGAQVLAMLGAIDAATLNGQTAAAIQTAVINAITNGAGAAYDTLVEIQALLEADDTADAIISAGLAIRARFFAGALTAGATPQNVVHNLGLANIHDFNYRIVVAASGAIEEYDVIGVDANTVSVSDESGTAIPAGRRIFITAGV